MLTKQDFEFKNDVKSLTENNEFISNTLEAGHIFDVVKMFRAGYATEFSILDIWYESFKEMFEFHFKEDVFYRIETAEEFEFYRDLILMINGIEFRKPLNNPEIDAVYAFYDDLQAKKGTGISFESRVTAVSMFYDDVFELTLYQFWRMFERANRLIEYETLRLWRMFDSDIKLENWNSDINYKREEITISKEEIDSIEVTSIAEVHLINKKE